MTENPPPIRPDAQRYTIDDIKGSLYIPYTPQQPLALSEEKIENCLLKYKDRCENSRLWIVPLSIFITIVISRISSTTHDFIISASTWDAIFIISALISLGYSIYFFLKYRTNGEIQDIIQCLKE